MSMTDINKTVNVSVTTTTELPGNITDPRHDPKHLTQTIGFLLIPFSVIAFFCVISCILYYMLKKRRLDQLRHHLVPLYTFDPGEGDDWEAEVLEPNIDPKQQKRLHDYKTMDMGNATSPRL